MTPHESLTRYLERIESAVGALRRAYIEYYGEELLTPTRANLRLRIRFESGRLLEISEALVIEGSELKHLDYRYHCQDHHSRLVFRYDSTPHFPGIATFPQHKHLPATVVGAERPEVTDVLVEAAA